MNANLLKGVILSGFILWYMPVLGQKTDPIEESKSSRVRNGLIDKSKRFTTVLAGVAISDDQPGYHFEFARGYQPSVLGVGAFSGFMRIPDMDFSDWTIVGLQLRASPQLSDVRPYFVFDYGIINMVVIDDKVNMRTASLDLGGGIEKQMGGSTAFLLDFRWKRFLDYQGERDAFTVWTINAGLKF